MTTTAKEAIVLLAHELDDIELTPNEGLHIELDYRSTPTRKEIQLSSGFFDELFTPANVKTGDNGWERRSVWLGGVEVYCYKQTKRHKHLRLGAHK